MNRRAYSVEEVAFAYGLKETTLWKRIHQGEIKAINFGTVRRPMWRITTGELDKFDKANTA